MKAGRSQRKPGKWIAVPITVRQGSETRSAVVTVNASAKDGVHRLRAIVLGIVKSTPEEHKRALYLLNKRIARTRTYNRRRGLRRCPHARMLIRLTPNREVT